MSDPFKGGKSAKPHPTIEPKSNPVKLGSYTVDTKKSNGGDPAAGLAQKLPKK